MQEWTLEPDEVLALPLAELALRVLDDARVNEEWNWRNWLIRARECYDRRRDVLQALSEAWAWLQAKGLIAWTVDQSAAEAFTITRRGHQVLDAGLPLIRAIERLDVDLRPEFEYTARPQFLRGDFETAAFTAMKQVEVAVRERAGFGTDLIGVPLMTQAFRLPGKAEQDQGGPLHQPDQHAGEATATMQLFTGAIDLFKNPASHRSVDFADPTMAAEIVLLADLLLRLLPDKTEEAVTAADPQSP